MRPLLEVVAELRALKAAATPGEWRYVFTARRQGAEHVVNAADLDPSCAGAGWHSVCDTDLADLSDREANGRLIAAMHNALDRLLTIVASSAIVEHEFLEHDPLKAAHEQLTTLLAAVEKTGASLSSVEDGLSEAERHVFGHAPTSLRNVLALLEGMIQTEAGSYMPSKPSAEPPR